jgi:hypothetical protein
MSAKNAALIAVAIFAVAWVGIDGLWVPPAFGHTDIYYFKDAALNFAQGMGLTTRFTYGNPTFEYRDFSTYPPLYPLMYGLFARVSGISAAANQMFNTLIDVVLGVLGLITLRPVLESLGGGMRLVLTAAVGMTSVAVGFFGPAYDRPDGLAAALGMAALLTAFRGRSRTSAVAAGLLCGFTLFTSPFVGSWTCLLVLIGFAVRMNATGRAQLRDLLWVALGGGLVVVIGLCSMALYLPGWFRGFSGVATGLDTHNETGGGYFLALLRGDWRTWAGGLPYSWHGQNLTLIQLALVMAVLLVRILLDRREVAGTKRLALLLMVAPICLVTSPYQTHYPPAAAALLVVAWICIEQRPDAKFSRGATWALLGAFAALSLSVLPARAADLLVRLGTRASLDRSAAFLREHHAALSDPIRLVAVSPSVYMLWREAGLHPLITVYTGFARLENRQRVDFLALAYPGSGNPLKPQVPSFVTACEYAQVYRPSLPQRAMLWGHPFSNSSQTWDTAIYARTDCASCVSAFAPVEARQAP